MKNAKLILITAALSLFSCKKIVTLKLNNVPQAIVIQGEVTNQPGPYYVTISRPVDFYADNNFPPVSGATVVITDNSGQTDSLIEVSPGVYGTHILQGAPDEQYTLSVTAGGVTYTAVSTMPATVNLDSVTFVSNSGFGRKRISAVANFQDPVGEKNYYQFIEYLNGAQLTKDLFVFDDRLSDGRYIDYTLFNDSSYLQQGDNLTVNMYCIDSAVYNYFFQLLQSGGAGSFNTSASPANPTSNISNGAYGYFSAHTVSSQFEYVP
ncbi:MAG TPA: DUF4249 domain-containing protein [Puia sp.]|jgi:hypothetical protein|nr:DUF4249 domain-containing protein [Puia sp.]